MTKFFLFLFLFLNPLQVLAGFWDYSAYFAGRTKPLGAALTGQGGWGTQVTGTGRRIVWARLSW